MSEFIPDQIDLFLKPSYTTAIIHFNSQQWYAAHDGFEELWYEASGDLRELLQGIIQVSVAEYHLDNGNTRGSILLMAEGLNHLDSSQSLVTGYDLARLRDLVRQRLCALQSQVDLVDFPKPHLSPMDSVDLSKLPSIASMPEVSP
jgi:predicted metal-dependent hydrolase